MIPRQLLKLTEGRGLAICPYGPNGTNKTIATCTLPPPIWRADFEGGGGNLTPWTRKFKRYDEGRWTYLTQEERETVYNFTMKAFEARGEEPVIKVPPGPLIDQVYYDNLAFDSYEKFIHDLIALDLNYYSSTALDSLDEMTENVQSLAFGKKNVSSDRETDQLQELNYRPDWGGIQRVTGTAIRKMRNLRDVGMFVYLTAGQQIDKDYVKDPRSSKQGETVQEPYNVMGTVNVPGKMVATVQHAVDMLLHTRVMNGKVSWVRRLEMFPGGTAHWETKDRYGRLPETLPPNVQTIVKHTYGSDGFKAIYEYAYGRLDAGTVQLHSEPGTGSGEPQAG